VQKKKKKERATEERESANKYRIATGGREKTAFYNG